MCLAGRILRLLHVTAHWTFGGLTLKGCVFTQVQITCTGQLLVVDTPPQPAEPPVGTLIDILLSLPQSSESTNIHYTHNTQYSEMPLNGKHSLKLDEDTSVYKGEVFIQKCKLMNKQTLVDKTLHLYQEIHNTDATNPSCSIKTLSAALTW